MKLGFYFVATTLLLTANFSQAVTFQKLKDGVGYSIENKKSQDNFTVKLQLPSDMKQKDLNLYVARATGEECSERGFQFFDYADPINGVSEGFCFKENKRYSFAIQFTKEFAATPPKFIIEDLNAKTNSLLKVGDEVLKVDGKTVTSVPQLKSMAFNFGSNKKMIVEMEIKRDGKNLKIKEPIAEMKNGAYTAEDLFSLRRNL